MNELILSLLSAILAALGGWVVKTLIPYIKSKTTLAQQEKINGWVMTAVTAAEQMKRKPGSGDEKFAYVRDFLRKKGFDLSTDEIEALIESAVQRMKAGVL